MAETMDTPVRALIVVDVQNDFADPKGSLYVTGGEDTVPVINTLIEQADGPVIYTQDWHPPVTPHFATSGGVWPEHCVRDTWGAALHPDLIVDGPVVRKGTRGEDGYSGFTMRDPESGETSMTELVDLLQASEVTEVTVVGLALDVCVKATALDAIANEFDTRVLLEACRSVDLNEGDGVRAVDEMLAHGVDVVGG